MVSNADPSMLAFTLVSFLQCLRVPDLSPESLSTPELRGEPVFFSPMARGGDFHIKHAPCTLQHFD